MPTAKIVVAQAEMIEARSTVTLVGTVEPVRRSRVGAQRAGLLIDVPVRQGDHVLSGGVIAKLKDATLRLQLTAEQAKLKRLTSRHAELVAGTRSEELRRLKALADAANADFDRWKFEMDRIDELGDAGNSNAKEYNETRADYLASGRRRIATEAAYKLGVEGPRVEQVAQAAHAVAEQQAVVDTTAADIEKMVVRAPFDGLVVMRSAEVGEWVSQGGLIVEMVDLHSVLVRVDVPEAVLPHLVVGETVPVKVDALKQQFEGRVKHIMRQADVNARTFPVDVEIDNPGGALAGGMFARAVLPTGAMVKTVAVPKDAIVVHDGVSYVGLVMPGHGGMTAMLSPVTTGLGVRDLITITSGNLPEGSTVAVRGNQMILPFPNPVEIVDKNGSPVGKPQDAHGVHDTEASARHGG